MGYLVGFIDDALNLLRFAVILSYIFLVFLVLLIPLRAMFAFLIAFFTRRDRLPKPDKQISEEANFTNCGIMFDDKSFIWLADTDPGRLDFRANGFIDNILTALKGGMQPAEITDDRDGEFYLIRIGEYSDLYVSDNDEKYLLGSAKEINHIRLNAVKYLFWKYSQPEDIELVFTRYLKRSFKTAFWLTIFLIVGYLLQAVINITNDDLVSETNSKAGSRN